jgi:hypothetical protein
MIDTHCPPTRVTMVGMDQRMRNAMHLFFQGPCRNRCVLSEEASAEIAIIDLDIYRGQELYAEYQKRHPEQVIILLSLHETEVENAIFVQKPLKTEQLVAALENIKKKLKNPPNLSALPIEPEALETCDNVSVSVQAEQQDPLPVIPLQSVQKKAERKVPSTHNAAIYLDEHDARAFIGSAPDIDANSAHQAAKIHYDPGDFLQGYLRGEWKRANEENLSICLTISNGSITLNPNSDQVIVNIRDSHLRTLSSVPLIKGTFSTQIVQSDQQQKKAAGDSLVSLDALMWKIALWASRGRVPVNTSLNTPVFLRRWPNMTRLMLFPHALHIATVWVNQPLSLLDTASALSIPQRYVFGFYSAAHAIRLAGTSKRMVDTLFEPEPFKKDCRRGLFARILSRLHRH